MVKVFPARWSEDGTATCLARVCAINGSGAATGVNGEGRWITQSDLSAITCNLFDVTAGSAAVSATVTSAAILNTPVTSQANWASDTTGYNFLHTLPITAFPAADRTYRVEYKLTLNGGEVFFIRYQGSVVSTLGS